MEQTLKAGTGRIMDFRTILKDGAGELGVPLGPARLDSFETYIAELLKWNKKVNLTSIDDPREVAVKHFLDSLALVRLLPEGGFRAADIGSGAGFPGLALKVALPGMELSLIEPARKKATFLRRMIRLLRLAGAEVLEERAEVLAQSRARCFDVILSRAFKGPSGLLPLAGPLLQAGGIAALSLGPGSGGAVPPGWRIVREEHITLPFSDYKRILVSYARTTGAVLF